MLALPATGISLTVEWSSQIEAK